MKKISTWHIHIKGQVQGVGFRPFVYQRAQKFGLTGWVNNAADGVHIVFNADEVLAKEFYDIITLQTPHLAFITSHSIEIIPPAAFKDFHIAGSNNTKDPVLLVSPDFAMCESCREEIKDPSNRRNGYAFTTCTQCGPRYSILKQLPYDRAHTSMETFEMCGPCSEEYNEPTNRRHYSQTNSCFDCAVKMTLYDKQQQVVEEKQAEIISSIVEAWKAGKIVALKGIGGYLLTCDASNEAAITGLRKLKHRPAKPFALMFATTKHLSDFVTIQAEEIKELQGKAAPIVLLQVNEIAKKELAINQIAPQLSTIGVMLPYTPLYHLLLQQFLKPIVASSGNMSNASIVYQDENALIELGAIADYILVHNREIITPQDDSVIVYSRFKKQRLLLRRSRGFAPLYYNNDLALPQTTILAMGALLKSTFTLVHCQNIHISQYLGDTDNYNAQESFKNTLHHFLQLFKTKPGVIITDKHPDYFTTGLGEQLARHWGSDLVKIQHHEAHFSSVLGEHNLVNENEPVLGVIWDGTGYGNDGQIWGGEFFVYQHHAIERVAHFSYFNSFLGDKMANEPRLSLFSICHNMPGAESIIKPKFTELEWNNYQKLIANVNLKTSSAGRIFDAAASLLGLIDKSSYESEAAMLLEEKALSYFKCGFIIPNNWLESDPTENMLSASWLMSEIVKQLNQGKEIAAIAAWFHVQLVILIEREASLHNCHKLCFSGGVFQNGLLVDLLMHILGTKYKLYFNKDVSSNDENISFGQVILWSIMNKEYIDQNP